MSVVNVGDVFFDLTVVGFKDGVRKSGKTKSLAVCRCACGGIVNVEKYNLTSANSKRCSKCAKAIRGEKIKTHGGSVARKEIEPEKYKTYTIWHAMKSRCFNVNDKRYDDYGGRGITVCERWTHSFQNFLEDMGIRPSDDFQIDRINNDGNYEPSNCRWASRIENASNKRNNRVITAFGKTQTLQSWERETGINRETIAKRLNNGYQPEVALTEKGTVSRFKYFVDGVQYQSLPEVAKALGCSVSGANGRFRNEKFDNWVVITE
jgi:hypothetical protein